jgi:ribonuclease D
VHQVTPDPDLDVDVAAPDPDPASGPADGLEPVEEAPELPLLATPSGGVPPVQVGGPAWTETLRLLAAGHGPVAVDAERASGYRYGQRAYLVQLNRRGAGNVLIDPLALPDLSDLSGLLSHEEWIIHAASQDLPCLAELGLLPGRVFDTELAGRILGLDRVSLGAMVERYLGMRLAKEHSAADWSTRPLPPAWLNYATLDVDVLVDLRDALAQALLSAGKLEWALQEFEHGRTLPPAPPRQEPWRRLSGIHSLKGRRALAEARGLWLARDAMARQRDVAPGRVLPDRAIINAVSSAPTNEAALLTLPVFSGPRMRKQSQHWWSAIERARALGEDELPPIHAPAGDGPPTTVARWADKDPAAARRITAARVALAAIAAEQEIQVEVLLEPAVLRRICWTPPSGELAEAMLGLGARAWQVQLTAADLSAALV